MVYNYHTYFQREIERYPGEKKDLLRLKVNPYLDYTLRQIRPIGELDKLIGKPHDNVSKTAKTVNFLFGGKIYHIDKGRQRKIKRFLRSRRMGTLKAAMNKAAQNNNPSEQERLRKLYQETARRTY